MKHLSGHISVEFDEDLSWIYMENELMKVQLMKRNFNHAAALCTLSHLRKTRALLQKRWSKQMSSLGDSIYRNANSCIRWSDIRESLTSDYEFSYMHKYELQYK